MTLRLLVIATLVSNLTACTWPFIPTDIPSQQERDKAQQTVAEFSELAQLAPFFAEAVAYAVYSDAFRASTGFGAAYGSGWLFRDGAIVGRTTMYQISVGVNVGAQWYRQILFFQTEDALRRWQRGTFAFAGEAGAAAGTWGAAASPSFGPEVALFTELRGGLLVELSVATHRYEYAPIEAPR